MNIVPKFEPYAFNSSDWPEIPTVAATPGSGGDLVDLTDDLLGALQRGRVGKLNVDQHITHVLRGDKTARRDRELAERQQQQSGVDAV